MLYTRNRKKKENKERKTFIMFWNPALSNWTLKDNTRAIKSELIDMDSWAIWDYSEARAGDRYFMVKCGAGKTGICQSGFITSKAFKGEDWSGMDRDVHYVDLVTKVAIDPERCPILTTDVLRRELPGFDWTGGHSGRLLSPEMAERLETLWRRFLKENEDMFNKYAVNNGDYARRYDYDPDEDDDEDDYDDDDENTAEVTLTDTGRVHILLYCGDGVSVEASTLAKAKEFFVDKMKAYGKDPDDVKYEYLSVDEEYYEMYEKVLTLVTEKHRNQRDKAGMPYMGHLARVAEKCVGEEEKMVALMHDLVEDTDVDEAFLRSYGIPEDLVDAVISLTKREGEDYMDFIDRVSNDSLAREVKIADLEDNMDITRLYDLKEEDLRRLQKYHKAWRLLNTDD